MRGYKTNAPYICGTPINILKPTPPKRGLHLISYLEKDTLKLSDYQIIQQPDPSQIVMTVRECDKSSTLNERWSKIQFINENNPQIIIQFISLS
jgi:hypothetical protein